MKLRKLGSTGLWASDICLGAMNFGRAPHGADEATSRRVIDAFLEEGGNFIDTADAYSGGLSEEIVGRALKGRRDRVLLATKGFYPVTANFGDPPAHANAFGATRRHLAEALDASLRRLGTDFIDLYQVHCWDPHAPLEETLSALDDFVRQGKIRHAGLSNYAAWQVVEAHHVAERNGWHPYVTAQVQYSLICRDIEEELVPACLRHGLGILPWSPLGGGVLTAKYVGDRAEAGSRFAGEPANARQAEWRTHFRTERTEAIARAVAEAARELQSTPTAVSLAWLLGRPGVSSVIIGPRTLEHLAPNLAASSLVLPAEIAARLDEVSALPARYPAWFLAMSPRAGQRSSVDPE